MSTQPVKLAIKIVTPSMGEDVREMAEKAGFDRFWVTEKDSYWNFPSSSGYPRCGSINDANWLLDNGYTVTSDMERIATFFAERLWEAKDEEKWPNLREPGEDTQGLRLFDRKIRAREGKLQWRNRGSAPNRWFDCNDDELRKMKTILDIAAPEPQLDPELVKELRRVRNLLMKTRLDSNNDLLGIADVLDALIAKAVK